MRTFFWMRLGASACLGALLAGGAAAQSTGGGGSSSAAPGGSNTNVQFNNGGTALGGDGGFNYAGTGRVTITNSTANSTPLTVSGGSVTGASTVQPGVSVTATVNSSGNVDGALIFGNLTCTSCTGSTFPVDIQVGGGSIFNLSQFGTATFGGTVRAGLDVDVGSPGGTNQLFGWGNFGMALASPAAGVVQLTGYDAASPAASSLRAQGVVAGTTNTAGVSLTLQGGASTGTGAGGSILLKTTPAGATGSAQNAAQTVVTVDQKQHLGYASAAIPTATCGTSPTVTAGSTDVAGEITTGTTTTSCTLTFKLAYAAAPFCVVEDRTTRANITSYTTSITNFVATMTSNSGDKVEWYCPGN